MKSHLLRAQFDAPGKASVLTGSFVCKHAD
jgi:hypothetical protein